MKTANKILSEYLTKNSEENQIIYNQELRYSIYDAINAARKEAIEECAENAHAFITYDGCVMIDKQSILKLIDELK